MARKKKEDFDVVTASQTDDGTVVITSLSELSEERMNNVIRNAVASYDPENKQYSTYLKISASSETLTVDRIDELARGLQSSLTNVQTVNGIIRNYINKDDLRPFMSRLIVLIRNGLFLVSVASSTRLLRSLTLFLISLTLWRTI